MKREYHSASSSAISLINTIESAAESDPWAKFKGEKNVGELKAARTKLEDGISAEVRPILINEISLLKKNIGVEMLTKLLKDFVKSEQAIADLQAALLMLINMHKAATKC